MSEWFEWRDAPNAQFAVCGDPISHSWSPKMQQAALDSMGLPHRYVALRVPKNELAAALEHLKRMGYLGVNLTLPLKEEALHLSLEFSYEAKAIGAVNTISFQTGLATNTDAIGFGKALLDFTPPSFPALILGAGGAARAVAYALHQTGWPFVVWNRTPEKAQVLAAEFKGEALLGPRVPTDRYKLLINATSQGMGGERLPIEWTSRSDGYAMDLYYGSEPTLFLREANDHGWQTADGREMLILQGAAAFEFWLEQQAPIEIMREALKR